jgi:hypothetical protein
MKSLIKIVIVVFAVIFIYSCSNDTSVNNIPPPPSGLYTLNGTIENWTLGGNIQLKAELFDTNIYGNSIVISTDTVSTGGAFSLEFNVPNDSFLYPIAFNIDTSCISTVIVNPAGTKSSSSVGLGLFNDLSHFGYIYKSNYNTDTTFVPGIFFVQYLYLNQNVSITGSVICIDSNFQSTISYNFSGVRGWNKVVVLYNSYTDITVSANEPAGGKWYVDTYIRAGDTHYGETSFRQRMFRFNNCITCR